VREPKFFEEIRGDAAPTSFTRGDDRGAPLKVKRGEAITPFRVAITGGFSTLSLQQVYCLLLGNTKIPCRARSPT